MEIPPGGVCSTPTFPGAFVHADPTRVARLRRPALHADAWGPRAWAGTTSAPGAWLFPNAPPLPRAGGCKVNKLHASPTRGNRTRRRCQVLSLGLAPSLGTALGHLVTASIDDITSTSGYNVQIVGDKKRQGGLGSLHRCRCRRPVRIPASAREYNSHKRRHGPSQRDSRPTPGDTAQKLPPAKTLPVETSQSRGPGGGGGV